MLYTIFRIWSLTFTWIVACIGFRTRTQTSSRHSHGDGNIVIIYYQDRIWSTEETRKPKASRQQKQKRVKTIQSSRVLFTSFMRSKGMPFYETHLIPSA